MYATNRRRRTAFLLATSGALASVALISSPNAEGVSSNTGPAPSVTVQQWALPSPSNRVPAQLEDEAAHAAGLVDYNEDSYAGSWYDPTSGTIQVATTTPAAKSAPAANAANGLLPSDDVALKDAKFSLSEGQQILDDYFKDSPLGDRWSSYGLSPDGKNFEISMIGEPTAKDLASLATLPGHVVLTTGLTQKFRPTDALDDGNPFAGGGRIIIGKSGPPPETLTDLIQCTTGFGFRINGDDAMLTAGHCLKRGTTRDRIWRATGSGAALSLLGQISVFNDKSTMSGTTGTVPVGADNGNHGDLALYNLSNFGKSASATIWTSNVGGLEVDSRQAPAEQTTVCRFGSKTLGQLCGLLVTDTNVTISGDDFGTVKAADVATYPGTSMCAQQGDSGGPVYRISGGRAIAVGIISATRPVPGGCQLAFTGVEEAIQAWGGDIKFHS